MAIELRPYQQKAVDDIYEALAHEADAAVAILPTAAGKSVILAECIRRLIADYVETRVIVLTHVAKLLKQNCEKLLSVWSQAPCDFYSASVGRKNHRAQILFAGIQSVYKHAYRIQQCDVIFIDECHLLSPNETTRYRKFIADIRLINPHVKIIGLTASPWRLDSGVIYGQDDSLFAHCCHETTIPELIDGGFLCPITTKRTDKEIDLGGVHIRGGDYIASELQEACDKDEITRACVDEIVRLDECPGLLFATGVKHAYHVRDEIRERGFTCEVIDGDTPETQRDIWIAAMMAGTLDYLSNCGTLTTGIDIPRLRMIGDLAPTKSPALHVQKLGRLMRLYEGKAVGYVLDFARNVDEHGPIDLIAPKPKGKKGECEVRLKVCPECESKLHTTVRVCPGCGYAFPPPPPTFQAVAGKGAILSTQIEASWARVTDVSYARHKGRDGKPDTLRVDYQCGLKSYSEWQCFDHTGYARQKATGWWITRGQNPVPNSVESALTRASELRKPVKVRIRPEGKYVRIVGYDFDGE